MYIFITLVGVLLCGKEIHTSLWTTPIICNMMTVIFTNRIYCGHHSIVFNEEKYIDCSHHDHRLFHFYVQIILLHFSQICVVSSLKLTHLGSPIGMSLNTSFLQVHCLNLRGRSFRVFSIIFSQIADNNFQSIHPIKFLVTGVLWFIEFLRKTTSKLRYKYSGSSANKLLQVTLKKNLMFHLIEDKFQSIMLFFSLNVIDKEHNYTCMLWFIPFYKNLILNVKNTLFIIFLKIMLHFS